MTSGKISNIICTINEWNKKFEDDNSVQNANKILITHFGNSLLQMKNKLNHLIRLAKIEEDDSKKIVFDASIILGRKFEKKVEEFIDECCKEGNQELAPIVGDALSVDFVNPPPNILFFRGFFNNTLSRNLIIADIKNENWKLYQVILEHQNI